MRIDWFGIRRVHFYYFFQICWAMPYFALVSLCELSWTYHLLHLGLGNYPDPVCSFMLWSAFGLVAILFRMISIHPLCQMLLEAHSFQDPVPASFSSLSSQQDLHALGSFWSLIPRRCDIYLRHSVPAESPTAHQTYLWFNSFLEVVAITTFSYVNTQICSLF